MPAGIPVASMAIGKAGAKNAGIFAIQILALTDALLTGALQEYRAEMESDSEKKDEALQAG
jgi:5-(carboxyamino)imidazole ribonucleotide mutase